METKRCTNCKYLERLSFEFPCCKCYDGNQWRLNTAYDTTWAHIRRALINTYSPDIENVIFNDPATIVFWSDGTKTVVKATDEGFDPEKGLAMAISKKALGNRGNYYNEFKKWLEKYQD